jgi:drug/metabolite transporter (DMT)-like permease
MVTLLGLGAAIAYGAADFLGGAASRRATALKVVGLCVPVGLAVLLAAALLTGRATGDTPTAHGLAWGFGSGLAGGTGLIAFYRALARGPMSVVAPVSALAAAVLPVMVGTLRGERLGPAMLAGVVLCLAAIGLVSMEEDGLAGGGPAGRRPLDSGPLMAVVSGAAFGIFLVLLNEAGRDGGGLWPLVAARTGGLVVIGMALLAVGTRGPRVSGVATLALVVLSGVLDAAANVLYFLAAQRGMLSLAAVLASLYPAVTVLLARMVYSERLRAVQRVGLVVALAGVALVTGG